LGVSKKKVMNNANSSTPKLRKGSINYGKETGKTDPVKRTVLVRAKENEKQKK